MVKIILLIIIALTVGCSPYKTITDKVSEVSAVHRHSLLRQEFVNFYELQLCLCLETGKLSYCDSVATSQLVEFENYIARDYLWYKYSHTGKAPYTPSDLKYQRLWGCLGSDEYMEKTRYLFKNNYRKK